MSTDVELVEQTMLNLDGYTTALERLAPLGADIDATDTTITTSGGVVLDTSIVEIGTELIYVGAVSSSTGDMTGCIRGYRGTTAAAHASGTPIRENPRVPRYRVQTGINDTLRNLAPRVVAVKQTEITVSANTITYEMPEDCLDILTVQLEIPGGTGFWPKSRRWRFNRSAPSSVTNGRTIDLLEGVPGKKVLVTYTGEPTAFAFNPSAPVDFETCGLPYWCEELVRDGALARLVATLDATNFTAWTASQHALNAAQPIGSSLRLSQFLLAAFEQKVEQARARQRREWDILTHYTG